MLRVFVLTWLFYWGVVIILPVEWSDGIFLTFAMQAVFVIFMASGIALGMQRFRGSVSIRSVYSEKKLSRMLNILSFGVFSAPILLIIDKVVIGGLDYSQGLTLVRSAQAGEENSTTIFSILGYILLSQAPVLIFLALTHPEYVSRKRLFGSFVLAFMAILIFSILIGGRSPLFVFFTAVLTIYVANFSIRLKQVFWIVIISTIVFSFSGYIFFDRIEAAGANPGSYASIFMYWLRLQPNDSVAQMDTFSAIMTLGASYFAHSFYVANEILNTDISNSQGQSIFFFLRSLMSRMGIMDAPVSWPYSGVFSSITGQLVFQFGLFGYIIISFIYTWLVYISFYLLRRSRRGTMTGYLSYLTISTVILTPMILPVDFIFFPFAFVFGGITLYLVRKI